MNCQFNLFSRSNSQHYSRKPLIYTHLFNRFSFSVFKFSLTCKVQTLLFLGPQSFQIVTPSRSDFPLSELRVPASPFSESLEQRFRSTSQSKICNAFLYTQRHLCMNYGFSSFLWFSSGDESIRVYWGCC